MALLPLIGAGSTHSSGPYKDSVCSGLQFLMATQNNATGSLSDAALHHDIYSHLIATLALAEAVQAENAVDQAGGCPGSGTTTGGAGPCLDSTLLRQKAQLAIDYAISLQSTANPVGGWRYSGPVGADVSHHVWGVTALFAGRSAGLNVPQSAFTNAQVPLYTLTGSSNGYGLLQPAGQITENGVTLGNYQYNGNQQNNNGFPQNSNSQGLLAAVLLGAPTSHSRVQSFAADPYTFPSSPFAPYEWGIGRVYYNFHTTHLLHRVGGQPWSTWNSKIQQGLQAAQASGGHVDGSWFFSTSGADGFKSEYWNAGQGRHYTTCLSLLSMEQSFTHLRLGQ